MTIKAAIFNSLDVPIKLITANDRQLDANVPAGGYWKEVPEYVQTLMDVPDPLTLPTWPARWIALPNPSQDYFGSSVLTDISGQVTFAAPTGLQIKTSDAVVHSESGGSITVTFPVEGEQPISIQESGKDPLSRILKVVFFATYLEELKDLVDAERDVRLVADLTYNSITLDGDLTAQKNIAEAATFGAFQVLGGNTGWTMNWITADNTTISLSAADLEAFSAVIATRRETEYMASRTAKNNIDVSVTKTAADAALNAYLTS